MPELVITKPEDLKKLVGWTITEAGTLPAPMQAGIGMKLSHPAAACKVVVLLIPTVVMGLSGNVVIASPNITIESRDVAEKPKE